MAGFVERLYRSSNREPRTVGRLRLPADRLGSIHAVLLQLVVERALADPEQLRRAPAVSTDDVERVQDRLALELGERLDLVGLCGDRLVAAVLEPDVRGVDRVAVGEDRGALERVRELAHV